MTAQRTRLASCCVIKPPKSEASRILSEDALVSFVPMSGLGINTKDLFLDVDRTLGEVSGSYTYFAENDVILAKITPCFENGKLGIARGLTNGIGFGSSEFIVFRPGENIVPDYLYYFLLRPQFRKFGKRVMTGAVGHRRVPRDFIENTEILLPSISEQKRIVAILDHALYEIEQARVRAEKNLQNARDLFESFLQKLFSFGSDKWEYVKLEDITESISDGDHSAPPKSDSGIPFITISNINKSTREIDFSETFSVPKEYFMALKEKRRPKIGDVLYTVTGSYGIPVLIKNETEFCFQRHIGLVRPANDVDSTWLYYLLLSPQVFDQANKGAKGAAQKTVSLKTLRNILVPRIPYDIQVKMAQEISSVQDKTAALERIYVSKLRSLEELKESILDKAFVAQLTNKNAEGAAA
ncbi:restriction endonuclease subunit S [Marinobacter salarius]|uniref:restriction endonuclease subunit S n=1 Tax=Marinobacter salarius TaxID=1420917 RepID=UPI00273BD659|nr:restriction endonuclease subunit S [Marinobacter salarius]MDP4533707.1 restriction endonuclease subunit S [Marinobacter salarius]